jgi:hypothetical protein
MAPGGPGSDAGEKCLGMVRHVNPPSSRYAARTARPHISNRHTKRSRTGCV